MQRKLFTNCFSFVWIGLACLLVYFPVVYLDFQRAWDDGWMIMNHYTVLGFRWENLKAIFTEYYVAQYSPVNQLIFTAIYAVFGYDPLVYHLYPVLLHIVNSFLVFSLLRRLISGCTEKAVMQKVCFFTALLFAIHPMQVESIAWISASKIPLYTCFALLSMLTYIRYIRTGKIRFYLMAFLLFICSFGSKEQSIVLPFVLLLFDWFLGRTSLFVNGEKQHATPAKESWGYLLLEKMPFFLFALFAGLCTYYNQSASTIERWAGYHLGERMVFACYSLVEYIGKLAFPVNLLYLYPFPMAPGKPLPVSFYIYPVVVSASVVFLLKMLNRQHRMVIFGLLFFLVNMALVLHIIAMSRFLIIADRYVYLGSAGIFCIAVWYGVSGLQKMPKHIRRWVMAVVICYFLYLGSYAHYRIYAWKDSDTLKREFKELIDPDVLLYERKDPEPAIEIYEKYATNYKGIVMDRHIGSGCATSTVADR